MGVKEELHTFNRTTRIVRITDGSGLDLAARSSRLLPRETILYLALERAMNYDIQFTGTLPRGTQSSAMCN